MIIHDEIIQLFIQDKPIEDSVYAAYPQLSQKKSADPKRKDIVMELHSHILPVLENHSFYNYDLIRKLDSKYDEILNGIHLHLMLNAPAGYDIYQTDIDGEYHIYIDLIQIADYTRIVTEMMYILMHNLTQQCMSICMRSRYKNPSEGFVSQLDYETFTEGFSLLMAWNTDIRQYPFASAAYEQRKEKAFGYLYTFLQEKDTTHQKEILSYLKQATFWDKCTRIAGMFYLFDIYHEQGIKELKNIYDAGYQGFTAFIFQ